MARFKYYVIDEHSAPGLVVVGTDDPLEAAQTAERYRAQNWGGEQDLRKCVITAPVRETVPDDTSDPKSWSLRNQR